MENKVDTIKLLREKCGVGISDCKDALEEAKGDINKAIEILRKKGMAKAAKRSGREISEGIIKVDVNEDRREGYIVEINSETDFVARNEQFQNFAFSILNVIKMQKPRDRNELMNLSMENGNTVQENLISLRGVIGENLDIKQCSVLAATGTVAAYSHMRGKIGVLVAIDKKNEELAHDIAMQIAAANPKYILPEDVPADEIAKEEEIYREQLLKEGKEENIIEKILPGKLNKYLGEVCLVKQEYIKDDKKKVEDILEDVKVEGFIRYSL